MGFHHFDKITEVCYGKYIKGIKEISKTDEVFEDHFPGLHIYPGSLILEGLAQLAGAYFELRLTKESKPTKRCVLSIVKKMKFRKAVLPGDKLLLVADELSFSEDFGVVYAKAFSGDEIKVEGELTLMFVDLDNDELQKARDERFEVVSKEMVVIDGNSI